MQNQNWTTIPKTGVEEMEQITGKTIVGEKEADKILS